MMGKLWTKVGVVLIGGLLLGSGMLAAQHVQAHKGSSERLPTPSCGNLPTATFFADAETTAIENSTAQSTEGTKQGGGVTGRGDTKYRYAKITIPTLAAGELRVSDNNETGPSDAVLCRSRTQVARSITSYSAHNTAHTAAAAATRAATAATTAQNKDDGTDSDSDGPDVIPDNTDFTAITNALSRVRTALNAARTALDTAARALYTAAAANPVEADRDAIEEGAEAARTAEQNAKTSYDGTVTANDDESGTKPTYPSSANTNDLKLPIANRALANAIAALGEARNALNTAATNLSTDANSAANRAHEGFQLRAAVSPGDEEYILVVAPQPQNAGTALPFSAQFHGAIAASDVKRNRSLRAGVPDDIAITITTPGLLTLETTGSTDTIGMLVDTNSADIAQAESGGSGGNFKMVVPVAGVAHTLTVDGQTTRTSGAYTLDMDFKVAMALPSTSVTIMPTTGDPIDIDPDTSPWTAGVLTVAADDTMVQIQRRAADGNVADEDYFLFTPANAGFLTVNANDDNTAAPDANTRGTLFGAMGMGPMMDQRAGQIATDDNSGPGGTHFKLAVPVEGSKIYLVKVEGTDGAYALEFTLTNATTDPDSDGSTGALSFPITLPHSSIPAELTAARERDWYLFNIEEPGTLYLETTGPTDVVGFLHGPDGSMVGEDDNSGTGTNFRIAVNVAPGLHLLEVEGKTSQTTGDYTLVSSFVAGPGPEPPTEPTTPTDPDPEPEPETDATGSLDNPPNRSTRSGIGIINGWVCQAKEVTITITPVGSTSGTSFSIGYGGNRPDTVTSCDHTLANTGFAMAYNFSQLAEGDYNIEARADGELIGRSRRFTVLHLVPYDPADPLPIDAGPADDVEVPNFPTIGETTTLEWERSSQNFVITDVQ